MLMIVIFAANGYAADPIQMARVLTLSKGYFIAFEDLKPANYGDVAFPSVYFGRTAFNNQPAWKVLYASGLYQTGIKTHEIRKNPSSEGRLGISTFINRMIYGFDEDGQPLMAEISDVFDTFRHADISVSFGSKEITIRCDDGVICAIPDSDLLIKVNADLASGWLLIKNAHKPVLQLEIFRVRDYAGERYIAIRKDIISSSLACTEIWYIQDGKLIPLTIKARAFIVTQDFENPITKISDPNKLRIRYSLKGGWTFIYMPNVQEISDQQKFFDPKFHSGMISPSHSDSNQLDFFASRLTSIEMETVIKRFPELKPASPKLLRLTASPCALLHFKS